MSNNWKNQKKIHSSNNLNPLYSLYNCNQYSVVKWCKDAEKCCKSCWYRTHCLGTSIETNIKRMLVFLIDSDCVWLTHQYCSFHWWIIIIIVSITIIYAIDKSCESWHADSIICKKCYNTKIKNNNAMISQYQYIFCRSRTRSCRFMYICLICINIMCIVEHFSVRFFWLILQRKQQKIVINMHICKQNIPIFMLFQSKIFVIGADATPPIP